MLKRLLVLLAFITASAATAQVQRVQEGFNVPHDVPLYVEVVPIFASGTTDNHPLDASVTPPPADSDPVLATVNIPSNLANTLDTGVYGEGSGFVTTVEDGGVGVQAKVRFHANTTKFLYDDPQRNFCQPGTSHLHEFFGNYHVNACSTRSTIRGEDDARGRRSFFAGGDANATPYWIPAIEVENPFGDGKDYAHQSNFFVIYYEEPPSEVAALARLHPLLRYVFGNDMDDPEKSWVQDIIDDANAQPGTANRYRLTNPSNGYYASQPKWRCFTTGLGSSGSEDHLSLTNEDGSDPWEGRCAAGDTFYWAIAAEVCWDGVNVWSPGGYRHMMPKVWDTDSTASDKFTCPQNYYRIPELVINAYKGQQGHADRARWRFSSDAHMQAQLIAQGSARVVRPGESGHADWGPNGWDLVVLDAWQDNCLAAGDPALTPHECNQGIISSTQSLKYGAVPLAGSSATRNPMVQYNDFSTANVADMWLIPASKTGAVTITVGD